MRCEVDYNWRDAPRGPCTHGLVPTLIEISHAKLAHSRSAEHDHNAQTLAQLAPAGPNRFEGKTISGQDVALSR